MSNLDQWDGVPVRTLWEPPTPIFSLVDQPVDVPAFPADQPLTLTWWMRKREPVPELRNLWHWGDREGNRMVAVYLQETPVPQLRVMFGADTPNDLEVEPEIVEDAIVHSEATPLPELAWLHCAVVLTPGKASFYLQGRLIATRTLRNPSILPRAGPLRFATYGEARVDVAQFYLFHGALLESQIRRLAAEGDSLPLLPTSVDIQIQAATLFSLRDRSLVAQPSVRLYRGALVGWVRKLQEVPFWRSWIEIGPGGQEVRFSLSHNDATPSRPFRVRVETMDGSVTWDIPRARLPMRQWCHMALVFDDRKLQFYLQGKMVAETLTPSTLVGHWTDPMQFGQLGDPRVDIAQLRWYLEPLTDDQLFRMSQMPPALPSLTPAQAQLPPSTTGALGCPAVAASSLVEAVPLSFETEGGLATGAQMIAQHRQGPRPLLRVEGRVRTWKERGVPWVQLPGGKHRQGGALRVLNVDGTDEWNCDRIHDDGLTLFMAFRLLGEDEMEARMGEATRFYRLWSLGGSPMDLLSLVYVPTIRGIYFRVTDVEGTKRADVSVEDAVRPGVPTVVAARIQPTADGSLLVGLQVGSQQPFRSRVHPAVPLPRYMREMLFGRSPFSTDPDLAVDLHAFRIVDQALSDDEIKQTLLQMERGMALAHNPYGPWVPGTIYRRTRVLSQRAPSFSAAFDGFHTLPLETRPSIQVPEGPAATEFLGVLRVSMAAQALFRVECAVTQGAAVELWLGRLVGGKHVWQRIVEGTDRTMRTPVPEGLVPFRFRVVSPGHPVRILCSLLGDALHPLLSGLFGTIPANALLAIQN